MEWREIPDCIGYSINEKGQVKGPTGIIIKLTVNSHGYFCFQTRKTIKVHRAVLLAFKGNPPEGKPLGRHLNGNQQDNSAYNLDWGSQSDNCQDSIMHGTKASKLNEGDVKEIRRRAKTETIKVIAEDYPVHYGTVCKIARGQDWAHIA